MSMTDSSSWHFTLNINNLIYLLVNAAVIGELISGPSAGQVTMTVKTTISGINTSSEGFHFIVTPILNGNEEESRKYSFPNYQNGTFVMILVEGLKPGRNYQFSVTAANVFGSSLPTLSNIISAGIGSCVAIMVVSLLCKINDKYIDADLDQSKETSNVASIAGGVVGGLVGMLVFAAFIVLLIVVLKITFMKCSGK